MSHLSRHSIFFVFIVMYTFLAVQSAYAAEEIEFKVIGLFKNAAMIEYKGKQKMLRSGQVYKKVIKLVSADSHAANFLVDGKPITLGLHESKLGNIFSTDEPAAKKSIRIPRDNTGMYRTAGTINGVPVYFLVDTGASQVAMNEATARKVGLQYKLYGQKVGVSTAAGRSHAWAVKLKSVSVGGMEIKQVDGMVVKGVGPNEVLLGMSFLRQLKLQDDGQLLKLTKKY
ncbi:MAG: TIGR02281 family clan AA aspartic protease [Kangiellaceae bacterium]|nr:TIGR02281 family clan AA aspartic protease [Kangiellaceae bacterium]